MSQIVINSQSYKSISIPTEKTAILIIQGKKGMLACGYINIETAEKLDEAVVIVTGVKNFDDMRHVKVKSISSKAKELGVLESMTGEEALALL